MLNAMLNRIHHTAIICSDYEKSKAFYCNVLGLKIIQETCRQERKSYKLDLSLNGEYVIELFRFPIRHSEFRGRKQPGCGILPLRWMMLLL